VLALDVASGPGAKMIATAVLTVARDEGGRVQARLPDALRKIEPSPWPRYGVGVPPGTLPGGE